MREACVKEALAIVAEGGLDLLSLRDVARRLGVSHQAPYKHFPSRDHILAEWSGAPMPALPAISQSARAVTILMRISAVSAEAYLEYARRHPRHYELMFGTPSDPGRTSGDDDKGSARCPMLRETIARLPGRSPHSDVDQDALFAWSVVHGLASILQTRAAEQVGIGKATIVKASAHTLALIGAAFGAPGREA